MASRFNSPAGNTSGRAFFWLDRPGSPTQPWRCLILEAPMPQLTRLELYELVWSKPMKDAAASVSMSSWSLSRICHRHAVPTPPRSYWPALKAGRSIARPPLPARAKAPRIDLLGVSRKPRAELLEGRARAIAALRQAAPAVPSTSARRPCTSRTEEALSTARPDRYGALAASGLGVARVRVSPEAIPRALSILDEIGFLLERLGHSISSSSAPAHLAIDGALVPFEISERFVKSDAPADAAELARREAFTQRFPMHVAMQVDPWMHRPSGRLMITLSEGRERALTNRWADGRIRLEQQLDQVVAEAITHAAAWNARQHEVVRRRAEGMETRSDRPDVGPSDETERQWRALLKQQADLYDEVERLGRFVRHLRHTSAARRSEQLSQFLTWAEAHVESLREACSAAGTEKLLGVHDEPGNADPKTVSTGRFSREA
jgi:hypothetical protein